MNLENYKCNWTGEMCPSFQYEHNYLEVTIHQHIRPKLHWRASMPGTTISTNGNLGSHRTKGRLTTVV